jgi:Carbohydrate family 9 binding domain-like
MSKEIGLMNSRTVRLVGVVAACVALAASRYDGAVRAQTPTTAGRPQLTVRPVAEVEVNGSGDNAAWTGTEWTPLRRRQTDGHPYDTRFKAVYSKTGIYFLIDGTDRKLTATMAEDFMDLWNEDVYEVFLWTDERYPVYFEYEISPLNRELPILIPNFNGQFLGWRPWHYEKDRSIRKATTVSGGQKTSGAAIQGWRAEFFIPYVLLRPLQNVPPKPGSRWRFNVYRMDHDDGKRTQWDWAPVGDSFHEFEKYGDMIFAGK